MYFSPRLKHKATTIGRGVPAIPQLFRRIYENVTITMVVARDPDPSIPLLASLLLIIRGRV